jgi:superoxide dismutase
MQSNVTARSIYDLPALPYALDALAPHLSRETLEHHWGKHHRGYVNRLNDLVRDSGHEGQPLEELIKHSKGAILNNAAQAWNHAFYWKCLAPRSPERPRGRLAAAIDHRFGSLEAFKALFTRTANPNHRPAQACGKCNFYKGVAGAQWGPCLLFPGKAVHVDGWCSAFTPKQ